MFLELRGQFPGLYGIFYYSQVYVEGMGLLNGFSNFSPGVKLLQRRRMRKPCEFHATKP